jgi:MFS family permease
MASLAERRQSAEDLNRRREDPYYSVLAWLAPLIRRMTAHRIIGFTSCNTIGWGEAMLAWFRDLTPKERSTMFACFGGWSLDAFDVQMYSFVIPTVIAVWGISKGEAGLIGTVTLLISSFGGWFSGTLADRYGRVKMLQITILWYSVFTFLCAFAQNFEQLFILRAMHGFGFGGEWAAGAVLMGEVIRDKYRGRGVGIVQTGWAVGWGSSALVYTAVYWLLPETLAWRVLFGIGLVPAVFVFWIRRHIDESEIYHRQRRESAPVGVTHLFSAFRGAHVWTTVKVSLMVAGAQGGGYALGIWMPAYLRTVRHLSATSTGGFLLVQIFGALCGFLLGTYLSDAIGRRWTFILSAILSFVMVVVYMFVPLNNEALLFMGIPLYVVLLMKFPPMGPFMTELFPTEVRGTAQGFCYNAGRAIGSFFPTMVGYLSTDLGLGASIGILSASAFGLMIVMLLLLPETRGRNLAELDGGTAAIVSAEPT